MSVSNYNACSLNTGSLRRRADWTEIVDVGENIRRSNGKVGRESILKDFHKCILSYLESLRDIARWVTPAARAMSAMETLSARREWTI